MCISQLHNKPIYKIAIVRTSILKLKTITMIIFYILMRCVFSLHSRSLARVSRLSSVFCACVNKTTKEFEGGEGQSTILHYSPSKKNVLYDISGS